MDNILFSKKSDDWQDLALSSPTLTHRFWTKVNKGDSNSYWLWTGAVGGNNGYGVIKPNGRKCLGKGAHRISWLIHFGKVPKDKNVLHKCDNPLCVNPNHLYLGTHQDNMKDRTAKLRHNVYAALVARGLDPNITKPKWRNTEKGKQYQREYHKLYRLTYKKPSNEKYVEI